MNKTELSATAQALLETADQTAIRMLDEAIRLILDDHSVRGAGLVAVVREYLEAKRSI
jgi:hypothetical protein